MARGTGSQWGDSGQQVTVTHTLDLMQSATITGITHITKTDDYTLTKEDSGKVIIANDATDQPNFTLPAVADGKGLCFTIFSLGAFGLKVTALTAAIVSKNNAAATTVSYETTSEKIGSACMIAGNGSKWFHMDASNCAATLA